MALLSSSLVALSAQRITLDDAVQIGLEKNHNIRLAEHDLRIAEEDVSEAFAYAMPNVTLNSSYTRNVILPKFVFGGGFFPDPFMDFNNQVANALNLGYVPFPDEIRNADPQPVAAGLRNAINTTIEINQPIFDYVLFNGIGATSIYKKAQEENLNSNQALTVKDSKLAFYSALLAKESVDLVDESYNNAQQRAGEIAILFDSGLVSEYDKLRSSVQVENLKSEKTNAETNYRNALNGLKITIGMDPKEEIELDGSLEQFEKSYSTPTVADAEKEIFDGNFDLRALDYQVEVQDAFVENEVGSFFPIVNLFANYSYQGQADDFDFITFDQSAVGVRLSWTLFQGFKRSAKLEKAKINKEKVLVQKDLLKRSLNNQAELISLRMQTAKDQIDAGEKNVFQAERGYDIAGIRYREGVGSLLEINDADLALRQAKLNKLQAVYNYLSAKAEFENLKGNK